MKRNPGKRWIAFLYNWAKKAPELVFSFSSSGPFKGYGWHWLRGSRGYSGMWIPEVYTFGSREKLGERLGKDSSGKYLLLASDGSRDFVYTDGKWMRTDTNICHGVI